MTAFVVALILIIGGGGTALASDAARPGDFLFPLERSLEDIKVRLALSDESREQIIKDLTEERLQELREIIDEEIDISVSGTVDDEGVTDTASSTVQTLMIEADVFTDTTVIKIEINGKEFYFETTASTREDIMSAIIARFPVLTMEQIESRLDLEVENRVSRPKDRGIQVFFKVMTFCP